MIMRFIQGFCMALADSVPGVSGGTIAFLLGFYDDFIGSLNNIVSKDKEKRKSAYSFVKEINKYKKDKKKQPLVEVDVKDSKVVLTL